MHPGGKIGILLIYVVSQGKGTWVFRVLHKYESLTKWHQNDLIEILDKSFVANICD